MALTFFWRCETTTFDATDDFSVGDTTAGPTGGPSLNAAAGMVGSLGILGDANVRYYQFTNGSIVNRSVGSMAVLFRWSATAASNSTLFDCIGTDTENYIRCRTNDASGHLGIRIGSVGPVTVSSNLTTALTANTRYGVILRWDQPNNDRCIELYDSSNALIEKSENLVTAYAAPTELGSLIRFGNIGASGVTTHHDNCFVADTYAEPIESFLSIASYTQYGVISSAARGRMLLTGIG